LFIQVTAGAPDATAIWNAEQFAVAGVGVALSVTVMIIPVFVSTMLSVPVIWPVLELIEKVVGNAPPVLVNV
jgi:hypothetical protein